MLTIGKKFGPYEIDRELGSGSMGAVYRARHLQTGELVAIKVMAPGLGTNEIALARFEREMDVLKQLRHPHIVRLIATGRYKKAPFYVMEYIRGESLDRILQRKDRFTWEETVELGRQLCLALQHAHEKGIIHRDLKPSNLMITSESILKLTDFGIAKDLDVTALTGANCTVGTAAYMSPEQCRGERNLSHKSDLYSLGVVFYELLTGEKPFKRETTMDMFMAHVNEPPPRPSRLAPEIPVWLDNLVVQLLEKKPEHRPYDALKVGQSLQEIRDKMEALKSVGVEAAKGHPSERPRTATAMDETDRNAARTLAGTDRKRRKRRKPFYKKKGIQAAILAVLLLSTLGAIGLAFLPSGADKLYAQAQDAMPQALSGDAAEVRKARSAIRDYLRYYEGRDPARTAKVRQWSEQIETDQCRRRLQALMNSRKGRQLVAIKPDTDVETKSLEAGLAQESGDLEEAARRWKSVEELKGDADPEKHAWGLLAESMRAEIDRELLATRQRRDQLPEMLNEARRLGKELKPDADPEQLALLAQRYEEFGDLYQARRRWLDLKARFDKDPSALRPWGLLAILKLKDPNLQVVPDEQEGQTRREYVQAQLTAAQKLSADKARYLYQEIIALYERMPELTRQVQQAREMLHKLDNNPPQSS